MSLDRYRDNLGVIADAGAHTGSRVVFITAATDHAVGAVEAGVVVGGRGRIKAITSFRAEGHVMQQPSVAVEAL